MNLNKSINTVHEIRELSIDFTQTIYMLISSPTYHPKVNIDNNEPKEYRKYLWVYIDKHLNWQPDTTYKQQNSKNCWNSY